MLGGLRKDSWNRDPSSGRGIASWGLAEAFAGLVVALALMALLVQWFTSGDFPAFALGGNLAVLLSYVVVWVPLLTACALACFVWGTHSLRRDYGLTFTWLDVLFGLGVGLFARGIASVIEISVYGQMTLGSVTLGDVEYNGWWIFGAILAPILVAPFVEELFFRGLVLRATRTAITTSTADGSRIHRAAPAVAIIVSAVLFSALHLTEATNGPAALVLACSTLILGVGTGLIAVFTGRLGGAMVAHAVFNGSLLLAALTV
jgi:membrane protease YdiL (CAAX protease family)